MRVITIGNVNFNAQVYIPTKQNAKNQYLFNQVLDILNKYHMPATWNNDGISIPSICQKAIGDLKELGIKFDRPA